MGIIANALKRAQTVDPKHPRDPGLVDLFGFGAATTSGVSVTATPESAMRFSAVFACVKTISETLSILPLILYARMDDGGRERAREHPLYSVLHDAPNEEMTSNEYEEAALGHLLLRGNHYSEIITDNNGDVRALWPLRPDRVRPVRLPQSERLAYEVRVEKMGDAVTLPARRILHIRALSWDGIMGLSPIAMARESLGIGIAAEEYAARFYSGDGAVPVTLQHPGRMSEEAYQRLRKSWAERYGGLSGKQRAAILEEGMKAETIGLSQEDAQFIETRKFQVEDIARFYRMPLHKIQSMDRATFSNIEQQNIDFIQDTIMPWAVRWERAINARLLTRQERSRMFAEYLMDGLLRGDSQQRAEFYSRAIQWGWMDRNEVRARENLNPREGLDQPLQPLNMVPAGTDPLAARGGPTPGAGGGGSRIMRRAIQPRERRSAETRRRLALSFRPVFADAGRRIIRAERREVMKLVEAHLRQRDLQTFMAQLDRFYAQDNEAFRAFVTGASGPAFRALAEALEPELRDELGALESTDDLDIFVGELVAGFAARHLISSMGQLKAVANEARGGDVIAAVEKRFDEWEEKRPDRLAQRESIRANGAVSTHVYRRNGVTRKIWIAFGESCPFCTRMNGQVVELDGQFQDAGTTMEAEGREPLLFRSSIGHPPLHGACDCTIGPG